LNRNYNQYIKQTDLEWDWTHDRKAMVHRLTLKHIPTQKTVSGEVSEARTGRGQLEQRKRDLWEDLMDKLEEQVYANPGHTNGATEPVRPPQR
jgi:hypothetical protein